MKVLNLQCEQQHGFEGWFASEDDYSSQLARGLVCCPLCASTAVRKLPSAPRLNLGAFQQRADPSAPQAAAQPAAHTPEAQPLVAGSPSATDLALQAAWLQMARRVMEQTEDVGTRFAEEARKIHYGEAKQRGIRGQASQEDTQALLEEGITVVPLPLPAALKEPLH